MRVFRVFPWVRGASEGDPGHPTYVSTRNSAGRLDNPGHYRVLYVGSTPVAATAEAFGSFELWTPAMLAGPPTLPGSRRALAEYEVPDDLEILDLDDGAALVEWSLRPSQVVTRDRNATQGWALRVYQSGRFSGVRWWSYYNPDWGSIGLWDVARVAVTTVTELKADSDILDEARVTLMRSWVT